MSNKHWLAEFDDVPFEDLKFKFSASVGYGSTPTEITPLSELVCKGVWEAMSYEEKEGVLEQLGEDALVEVLDFSATITL